MGAGNGQLSAENARKTGVSRPWPGKHHATKAARNRAAKQSQTYLANSLPGIAVGNEGYSVKRSNLYRGWRGYKNLRVSIWGHGGNTEYTRIIRKSNREEDRNGAG